METAPGRRRASVEPRAPCGARGALDAGEFHFGKEREADPSPYCSGWGGYVGRRTRHTPPPSAFESDAKGIGYHRPLVSDTGEPAWSRSETEGRWYSDASLVSVRLPLTPGPTPLSSTAHVLCGRKLADERREPLRRRRRSGSRGGSCTDPIGAGCSSLGWRPHHGERRAQDPIRIKSALLPSGFVAHRSAVSKT